MAKAILILENGTKVTLEGLPDEIKALLAAYNGVGTPKHTVRPSAVKPGRPNPPKKPPTTKTYMRELIGVDFFKTPRALGAIQAKLAENGHIYPQNELSPRLIELTKKKELRRFKEKNVWVYVNR